MTLRAQWLGQAGFVLSAGSDHLVLDPYLSDSLAQKYAGTLFPHVRLLPAPTSVEQLPPLLAVACSHAHTDHMDPGTLLPLMADRPGLRLLCPRAELDEALRRSAASPDRLVGFGDGETFVAEPFTVAAVPAAHEERMTDERGNDRFLGFVVTAHDTTVYHSGDCTPWDGLVERLLPHDIDVALLPVNGRDAHRREHGVPGNFTFAEAVALCEEAGIATLVPHHWGMFDFNTVDPSTFDLKLSARAGVRVLVPEHGASLELERTRR